MKEIIKYSLTEKQNFIS